MSTQSQTAAVGKAFVQNNDFNEGQHLYLNVTVFNGQTEQTQGKL